MSEIVHLDEEKARQIIRDWLTVHNRSLRNLAQEAGIQPSVISRFLKGETTLEDSSALKLYSVLQQSMNPLERKHFIEMMGLLSLASAFSQDVILTVDLAAPPYETRSRLMLAGLDLYTHALYVEAIPLFRKAEGAWGGGSSQAAFAACMVAQTFIHLGDYHKAQGEASRIQDSYAAVMDPETNAELHRIRNWLDYYQGNFVQSEQWLRERIRIAKEGGIERLKNPHFLGRIYYDLGCLSPGTPKADQLFLKAELCFDQSYQIHMRWGDDHNRAFDLFRKAQVLHMAGKWEDAKRLRTRSREIFTNGTLAGSMGLLHIELEEARLLLANGEVNAPKRKARDVLTAWAHFKYAKGVADSLKILGELECVQENLESALEIFAAELCVYPYDNHPNNRQVWDVVNDLRLDIIRREGRPFYQELLRRIHTVAENRQGYFSYLAQIVPDRSTDVTRVLSRLGSLAV